VIDRRMLMAGGAVLLAGCAHGRAAQGRMPMYGLMGSMTATPGERDTLTDALLEGLRDMPGNRLYIVGHDPENAEKIWITEVWDSAESHRVSLGLPQVQAAIARARPVIAGMGDRQEFLPVGGVGL
jgi:quinol monooxygenase YgiN